MGEEYQEDMAHKRSISDMQKRRKLEVFAWVLDKDAIENDASVSFNLVGYVMEVRLMMDLMIRKNKDYALI